MDRWVHVWVSPEFSMLFTAVSFLSICPAPRLAVIGCILSVAACPRLTAAQPDSDEVARLLDTLAQGTSPVAALVHQTSAQPPELVDRISEALAGDARFAQPPALVRAHEVLSMLGGGGYASGYAQLMAGLRQPAVRRVAAVALAFQSAPEKRPEIAAALVAEIETGGLSVDEIAGLVHPIGQLGEAATGLLPHVKRVLEAPLTTDREKSLALRAVARIAGGEEALRAWKASGKRHPLLLLQGLAQFAAETEGRLNAPVATRDEFRMHVLDFLGSSEPEVRKAALEALAPAFGRELVLPTDRGYEPNPQIATRLMNLAEVHPDPRWRRQMTQLLMEVRIRADHFGQRGGARGTRLDQESVPGDESTDALLDLMTESQEDVRYAAMARLENRTVERELRQEEWKALVEAVDKANPMRAGMAARILARCPKHPVEKRARPVIRRFMVEIDRPAEPGTAHPAYLSPRVLKLNQFLLAFTDFPSAGILPLLKDESAQAGGESRLWLMLARGMAGDSSVASDLREAVQTGSDVSVRAVTLRAYTRALGRQAAPLLEQYANDMTELSSESPPGRKVMPLQIVARDELARLRTATGVEAGDESR